MVVDLPLETHVAALADPVRVHQGAVGHDVRDRSDDVPKETFRRLEHKHGSAGRDWAGAADRERRNRGICYLAAGKVGVAVVELYAIPVRVRRRVGDLAESDVAGVRAEVAAVKVSCVLLVGRQLGH